MKKTKTPVEGSPEQKHASGIFTNLKGPSSLGASLKIWKGITGIATFVVIVLALMLFNGSPMNQEGKILSPEEITQRLTDLIQMSSDGLDTVSDATVKEEYGLYVMKFGLETEDGFQEQEISISKDGELLVMQAGLYEDVVAQIELAKQMQQQGLDQIQPTNSTEEIGADELGTSEVETPEE